MTIDDIALTMQPRLGAVGVAHLLFRMGSAGAVFAASADELEERCDLAPALAADIARRRYHGRAEKELSYMKRNGISAVASTDPDYPPLLRECNDYPHVLYYIGDIASLGAPVLSIVGTRRMTSYGQRMCDRIVAGLAEAVPSLVVVSGLAYGVDGAAHRAALGCGLRTVGVLACRLPDVSPVRHRLMAREMVERGGALLSEYRSDEEPGARGFIPRNRIIAGLGAATLVVESPLKGGAMVTAGMADGYHRTVMAVPGRADDAMSEGVNQLVKSNKAVMVTSADDILREMMWEGAPVGVPSRSAESVLGRDALGLLSLLREGETVSHDDLLERCGMTVPELAPLLLELEFEGFIRQMPGKMFEKI